MPWVRIHDGALSHPKLCELFNPKRPFDLWVWGLSYAQMHLTDGLLPRAAVPRGARLAVEALLEKGLWERAEGGFEIHDFLEWNDTKQRVRRLRTEAKDRMRKVREDRSREQDERTSDEVLHGLGKKELVISSKEEKALSPDRERFEAFWAVYPKKVGKGAAWKAWKLRRFSDEDARQMCEAVEWQRRQDAWIRERGRFVPNPATWLNEDRWQDEPHEAVHVSERTLNAARAAEEFLKS